MHLPMGDEATIAGAARRLAVWLAALVLLCAAPATLEANLTVASNWARGLLLGGGLLLAYLAWLALVPCREALWSITWVFAIAAAAGALAVGIVLFSEPHRPLPLGPIESRWFAVVWCCLIAALLSAGSIFAGRLATACKKH